MTKLRKASISTAIALDCNPHQYVVPGDLDIGHSLRCDEPESHTLGLEQSRQSTLRCRWRPRLRPW